MGCKDGVELELGRGSADRSADWIYCRLMQQLAGRVLALSRAARVVSSFLEESYKIPLNNFNILKPSRTANCCFS